MQSWSSISLRPQPCSVATWGRKTADRPSFFRMTPSRPTTMSSAPATGAAGVRTDISISMSFSSSRLRGGNRGSSRADFRATAPTSWYRGFSVTISPMQPRSFPCLFSVTNIPLVCSRSGEGFLARGAVFVVRYRSMVSRAIVRSAFRSEGFRDALLPLVGRAAVLNPLSAVFPEARATAP